MAESVDGNVAVRGGREGDAFTILALWDTAIAWLVARGQTEQWGSEPASAKPKLRDMASEWTTGPGLRIAEINGEPVGVSVITSGPPDYYPYPPIASETYLSFLVSDRKRAGLGIGSALVQRAETEARARGSQIMRVDCWAGASALVAWYERQGFTRSRTFTMSNGWRGQVFEMTL